MSNSELGNLFESEGLDADELRERRMPNELAKRAAEKKAKQDLERLRQEIRVATLNQVWIENYGDHFSVTVQGDIVEELAEDISDSFKCHWCGDQLSERIQELLRESVKVFRNRDYVRSFDLEYLICSNCSEPNEVTVCMTV